VLAWIETAILTGYGLILTATGLLVQAGVIKPGAHADRGRLAKTTYRAVQRGSARQRGVRMSNSLPSGSARHVHGTSPWPRSMSVAPSARSRATSTA